jgi:hypothetical protein
VKALEYLEHKLQVLDDSVARNDPFIVQTRTSLRDAIDEIKQLAVDAQRFRGIALFVAETDPAAQQRMVEAFEKFADIPEEIGAVTVESFGAMIDQLILKLAEARRAVDPK